MDTGKPRRIWKRVRFWGGVLLVLVVGVGILGYVTYRKAMGPPPTPPGRHIGLMSIWSELTTETK